RDDVRGFADERDAVAAEGAGRRGAEREYAAAGLDLDLAEDRMDGAFDCRRQLGVVERGRFVGDMRREHPDEARAVAGQRHDGALAGWRVEFGRGVVMRPRVP